MLIAAHFGFFVLKCFFYDTWPAFRQSLGFTDPPQPPHEAVVIASNQGVSNLFLAIGLAVGLALDHRNRPAGRPILMLFSAFIAVAGVVGFLTVGPKTITGISAFLVFQTGLGVAALLLHLGHPRHAS